jgi:hypothetical protein
LYALCVEKNTKTIGAFFKICIWQEFAFACGNPTPEGVRVAWREPCKTCRVLKLRNRPEVRKKTNEKGKELRGTLRL